MLTVTDTILFEEANAGRATTQTIVLEAECEGHKGYILLEISFDKREMTERYMYTGTNGVRDEEFSSAVKKDKELWLLDTMAGKPRFKKEKSAGYQKWVNDIEWHRLAGVEFFV